MTMLQSRELGADPDAYAPDGSEVRLLAALAGGSFAHFTLGPGKISAPVAASQRRGDLVCRGGRGGSVAKARRGRERDAGPAPASR